MKKLFILILLFCVSGSYFSCKNRVPSGEEPMPVVSVKASPLMKGDIENIISFNGSTVYWKKTLFLLPFQDISQRLMLNSGMKYILTSSFLRYKQRKGRRFYPGWTLQEILELYLFYLHQKDSLMIWPSVNRGDTWRKVKHFAALLTIKIWWWGSICPLSIMFFWPGVGNAPSCWPTTLLSKVQ